MPRVHQAWGEGRHPESKAHPQHRPKRRCRSAPAAPTNVAVVFAQREVNGRKQWRARVTWTAVTLDVASRPVDPEFYAVQLRATDSGGTPVETDSGNAAIWKDRVDADEANLHSVFTPLARPRVWYYQARVRVMNRVQGHRCWSAWTDWTTAARASEDLPPGPTNVTIHDTPKDRIVLDWEGPTDASPWAADRYDPEVHHFQAKLTLTTSSSASPYETPAGRPAFDRHIRGERKSFGIPLQDQDLVFYGWVRSVSSEGDPGPWIPATLVGNSLSGATPDGVSPLRDKVIATFTKGGTVEAKHYGQLWMADRRYRFKKVRVRFGRHDPDTHPDDGCPQGQDAIIQVFHHNVDESVQTKLFAAEDRLVVDANTHKDTAWADDMTQLYIHEDESLSVKVTQVGSTSAGEDMVVQVIMVPDALMPFQGEAGVLSVAGGTHTAVKT